MSNPDLSYELNEDDGAPSQQEDIAAIVACLGDDAAALRADNPECERAANMDAAAALIERLQALSVTNIMLGIVPGLDGMGREVYAESVQDVEAKLSDMGLRIEDHEAAAMAATVQLSYEMSDGAGAPTLQEEIESVVACLGDDAAALRDETGNPEDERAANMDAAAALIERLAAQAPVAGQPAEPSPACGGVPDPRCNYLATCGRVCMKCGRVHAPHLFSLPPPARWGSFEAAMADPVFQTARSIMGTENDGQDRQLLKAVNHCLAAPKGDSNG